MENHQQQKGMSKTSNISFSATNNYQFANLGKIKSINDGEKSSSSSNSNFNSSSNSSSNSSFYNYKAKTCQFNIALDPINELSKANNVIIKIEYKNNCCINKSNNLYNVFINNNTNTNIFNINNIKYLFRAKELIKSNDYTCGEYMKKPFCLNIEHVLNDSSEIKTKEFAFAERNFQFPCFCFCRPELKVRMQKNKNICGKIVLPFSFGDKKYKIYDKNNKLKYIVDTSFCNSGIFCSTNCCGYTSKVNFYIYNEKKEKYGTIKRRPGKYKEFIDVINCYEINFPKNSSFEDKFLLICTAFMIENEIYENKWGCFKCFRKLNFFNGLNCCCNECIHNCFKEIFRF